jgi:peptidyl-tRNA hydrolase, PTH1 family
MEVDIPSEEDSDVEFSNAWATLSKSARKKILKQKRASSHPRPPKSLKAAFDSAGEARASSEPPAGPIAPLLTPPRTPMQSVRRLPLLICGIGNPGGAYANTLHSTGLTTVKALGTRLGYPQFVKERALGNGLVSRNSTPADERDWTLWQSTSYMNESGKGVVTAFREFSRSAPDARLVVIYDELEKALGTVTVRAKEGASAKGHNGLRSIMASLGGQNFVRMGIGIGRPLSRESDDVAAYVLRKMTEDEKHKIEGCLDQVVKKLEELERS